MGKRARCFRFSLFDPGMAAGLFFRTNWKVAIAMDPIRTNLGPPTNGNQKVLSIVLAFVGGALALLVGLWAWIWVMSGV
jgi:hypothetical protein